MTLEQEIIHSDGPEQLIYSPNYCTDISFDWLAANIAWEHKAVRIFGKWVQEPRLTAWFGPEYRYAGLVRSSLELPPELELLNRKLATDLDFEFNSVLLNYYRNERDHMGWHRDNEREMDQTVIASVSLGGSRVFRIKHRTKNAKYDMVLENKSLLVMRSMQQDWMHAVPSLKSYREPRINLTFRRILS